MASSLRKAQVPVRDRGSNKCPIHIGKEVIFLCEDCRVLVCPKCVSTDHRKHAVDDISDIIPQVKVTIQDFVNKAETRYIPELYGELKNLDDKIYRNKNHFKDVISRISKHNENLKQELDKIANNLIALCREVENGNDDILKRHRTELQSQIEKLNARLLEFKNTLQSGTNTQVYDISSEIPSDVTISASPLVQNMDFKPTSFLVIQLERLMGEVLLTTDDSRTQKKSFVVSDQHHTDIAHERENHKEIRTEMSAKKERISDKPPNSKVQSFSIFQTFTHENGIHSICATSNDRVWVKDDSKKLDLLNNTGKAQKKMKITVDITDFCVSPATGGIWFCSYNDISVKKVIGDNMATVMFHTNTEPVSICISADGNILVGMVRQIVKYTQRGQKLCKSAQVKQVPVVRCPDRISLCPVTRNIVVVDRDSKDSGGDDKPHVSILDEDLQLLRRYYGRDEESFCPWDACYSDAGDIYIANNRSIQQISGKGEYIQTVYTHSDKLARYLCVQSNGNIWAGFGYLFTAKEIIILQKQ